MKFKPIFFLLLVVGRGLLENPRAMGLKSGLSQLAELAKGQSATAQVSGGANQLKEQLASHSGDLSELQLDAAPSFATGLFDQYKIATDEKKAVENEPVKNVVPERQMKQENVVQNPHVDQLNNPENSWKMNTLKFRQAMATDEINDFKIPAKAQGYHTEFSDTKVEDNFDTPMTQIAQSSAQSITGRLQVGDPEAQAALKSFHLPADYSATIHAASSQPRELPQSPTSVEVLKGTYEKLFSDYQAEMKSLQELKKKYQSEKELRNKAESDYENLRDSLQFQAHEYAQDLTVAKIDAADLLKSRESAKHKIEELKELDKEQAEHLNLLQRKHEYLYGAYEILKNKQQLLLEKKTNLTAQAKELKTSEDDYHTKLSHLKAQMADLEKDQNELLQSKAVIQKNRELLQEQVKQLQKRHETREQLTQHLDERKLGLEDAKKRLADIKAANVAKMKTVMTKISELEAVKQRNIEQLKELDHEKDQLEFDKSKLDEKLALLDKKERVLRQREADYQFKENICHCRKLRKLHEDDLIVSNPFQTIRVAQPMAPVYAYPPMMQAPQVMYGQPAYGYGYGFK